MNYQSILQYSIYHTDKRYENATHTIANISETAFKSIG